MVCVQFSTGIRAHVESAEHDYISILVRVTFFRGGWRGGGHCITAHIFSQTSQNIFHKSQRQVAVYTLALVESDNFYF